VSLKSNILKINVSLLEGEFFIRSPSSNLTPNKIMLDFLFWTLLFGVAIVFWQIMELRPIL